MRTDILKLNQIETMKIKKIEKSVEIDEKQ